MTSGSEMIYNFLPKTWDFDILEDGRVCYFTFVDADNSNCDPLYSYQWIPPKECWTLVNKSQAEDDTDILHTGSNKQLQYGFELAYDSSGYPYYLCHLTKSTFRTVPPVLNLDDAKKPFVERRLKEVQITRHPLVGYGFMLSSHIPIVITHIVPGGPAEGVLDTGDFVISIFDEKINYSSSDDVLGALKRFSIQEIIKLSIRPCAKSTCKRRPPPPPPANKTKVKFSIPITEPSNEETESFFRVHLFTDAEHVINMAQIVTFYEAIQVLKQRLEINLPSENFCIQAMKESNYLFLPSQISISSCPYHACDGWSFYLRIRIFPTDYRGLSSLSYNSIDYIFAQTCNDLNSGYLFTTFDGTAELLAIGLLLDTVRLASIKSKAKKLSVYSLRRKGLISLLFSKLSTQQYSVSSKREMEKQVLAKYKRLSLPADELEIKLIYLQRANELAPAFGGILFHAQLQAINKVTRFLVSPSLGLVEIEVRETGGQSEQFQEFTYLPMLQYADMLKVHVSQYSQGNELSKLSILSRNQSELALIMRNLDACEMANIIHEFYQRIPTNDSLQYEDAVLNSMLSNNSSPISHDIQSTVQYPQDHPETAYLSIATPPYSATHLVPVQVWSYCFTKLNQKNTLMPFCPTHFPRIYKARSLDTIRNCEATTSKHSPIGYPGNDEIVTSISETYISDSFDEVTDSESEEFALDVPSEYLKSSMEHLTNALVDANAITLLEENSDVQIEDSIDHSFQNFDKEHVIPLEHTESSTINTSQALCSAQVDICEVLLAAPNSFLHEYASDNDSLTDVKGYAGYSLETLNICSDNPNEEILPPPQYDSSNYLNAYIDKLEETVREIPNHCENTDQELVSEEETHLCIPSDAIVPDSFLPPKILSSEDDHTACLSKSPVFYIPDQIWHSTHPLSESFTPAKQILTIPLIPKFSEEFALESSINETRIKGDTNTVCALPDTITIPDTITVGTIPDTITVVTISNIDRYYDGIPAPATPTLTPPSLSKFLLKDKLSNSEIVSEAENLSQLQESVNSIQRLSSLINSIPPQNDSTNMKNIIPNDCNLSNSISTIRTYLPKVISKYEIKSAVEIRERPANMQYGLLARYHSLPNLTSSFLFPEHSNLEETLDLYSKDSQVSSVVHTNIKNRLIASKQPPIPKRRFQIMTKHITDTPNYTEHQLEKLHLPEVSNFQFTQVHDANQLDGELFDTNPSHFDYSEYENVSSAPTTVMQFYSTPDTLSMLNGNASSLEDTCLSAFWSQSTTPVPKSRKRSAYLEKREEFASSRLVIESEFEIVTPPTPPVRFSSLRPIFKYNPSLHLTENQSTSTSELDKEFGSYPASFLGSFNNQTPNSSAEESVTGILTTSVSHSSVTPPSFTNAPLLNSSSIDHPTNSSLTLVLASPAVNKDSSEVIEINTSTQPFVSNEQLSVFANSKLSYAAIDISSCTDRMEIISEHLNMNEQASLGPLDNSNTPEQLLPAESNPTTTDDSSAVIDTGHITGVISKNHFAIISEEGMDEPLSGSEPPSPPTIPPPVPCSTPPELDEHEIAISDLTPIQQNISRLDEEVIASLTVALNTLDNRNVSPIRHSNLSHFRAKIISLVHAMQSDIYQLTSTSAPLNSLIYISLSASLTNSLTTFAHDTEKLAYSHFCTLEQRRDLLRAAKEISQIIRLLLDSLGSASISEHSVTVFFSKIQTYNKCLLNI